MSRRLLVIILCCCTVIRWAVASETRAYAVSWFDIAGYSDPDDSDCPDGVNVEEPKRGLQERGYNDQEISRLVAAGGDEFASALINRGRIDGKPVNVYANPESVPEQHIKHMKIVRGRFGR